MYKRRLVSTQDWGTLRSKLEQVLQPPQQAGQPQQRGHQPGKNKKKSNQFIFSKVEQIHHNIVEVEDSITLLAQARIQIT